MVQLEMTMELFPVIIIVKGNTSLTKKAGENFWCKCNPPSRDPWVIRWNIFKFSFRQYQIYHFRLKRNLILSTCWCHCDNENVIISTLECFLVHFIPIYSSASKVWTVISDCTWPEPQTCEIMFMKDLFRMKHIPLHSRGYPHFWG